MVLRSYLNHAICMSPHLNYTTSIRTLCSAIAFTLQKQKQQKSVVGSGCHADVSVLCYLPNPIMFLTQRSTLNPLQTFHPNLMGSRRTFCTSNVCYKTFKKKKDTAVQEDDDTDDESEDEHELTSDDDDDDDDDNESSDFSDDEVEEPRVSPKDYKDVRHNLKSLRIDAVMSKGLNISRKKVIDAFLATKLRVNGNLVIKKGKKVREGDTLDLIKGPGVTYKDGKSHQDVDTVALMRVVLLEVHPEKTAKDNVKVVLRRWKNLKLPKSKVL